MNTKNSTNDIACIDQICNKFRDLAKSSMGPHGSPSLIKQGIGPDGDVQVTCQSARLLSLLYPEHPVEQLIIQTVKAHVNAFGDHGFYLLFLIPDLVLRVRQLQDSMSIPLDLITYSLEMAISWLQDDFLNLSSQRRCACIGRMDLRDWRSLISWLSNGLYSSNQVTGLDLDSSIHVATQIVKCFFESLPTRLTQQSLQYFSPAVRYNHVVGVPATETHILQNAIFIERDIPLDILQLVDRKQISKERSNGVWRLLLLEKELELDTASGLRNRKAVEEVANEDLVIRSYNDEEIEYDLAVEQIGVLVEWLQAQKIDMLASQKTMHPMVKQMLLLHDIIPLERLSLLHIQSTQKISGAPLIESLSTQALVSLPFDAFGSLSKVESRTMGSKRYLYLQGNPNKSTGSVQQTLVLCSSSEQACIELEFQCKQCLQLLTKLLSSPFVSAGAGCFEISVATFLRQRAKEELAGQLLGMFTPVVLEKLRIVFAMLADSLESLALSALGSMSQDAFERERIVSELRKRQKDHQFFGLSQSIGEALTLPVMQIDAKGHIATSSDQQAEQPLVVDLFSSKSAALLAALDLCSIIIRTDRIVL